MKGYIMLMNISAIKAGLCLINKTGLYKDICPSTVCQKLGLSGRGTKKELIDRLKKAFTKNGISLKAKL